jgi:hypothetical protein
MEVLLVHKHRINQPLAATNKEAGFAGDRTYKNGVDVVVLENALPKSQKCNPILKG